MSAKALKYAEDDLGVHRVYEDALMRREELDSLFSELDKLQDQKRILSEDMADREADLLVEERGKHADMSATALGQHMKIVVRKDQTHKDLRNSLSEIQSQISGLEYDVELTKTSLRILTARMEQLGGYLHYLAAVKQADTANKA